MPSSISQVLAIGLGLVATGSPPRAVVGDPAGRLIQIAPHAWAYVAGADGSSNSVLFVGDSAALIVDPGVSPAIAREFLAAVRQVTDRPVRSAILTHWHPDHALGVTCLAGRAFPVYSHGKTRRALAERGARVARAFAARAATPADRDELASCRVAIPDSIIGNRRNFDLGGRTIEVFHPGPAHTAGDLIAWDPAERVLATGDVFMHQASPDMGEAHPAHWALVLDSLVALKPAAVVAGHFGPSSFDDLIRFRDYLTALVGRVREALGSGTPPDRVPGSIRMPEFADFGQYPEFGATFAGNAKRVGAELAERPAKRGATAGFRTVAVLDVGLNPHQITFTADGATALVAVAGSDRVALVDVATRTIRATVPAPGTPLGVVPSGPGAIAVTRFQSDSVARYRLAGGRETGSLSTGNRGASLFAGPMPNGRYLLSVERTDRLQVFDPKGFAFGRSYPTGHRPFPPAATSDGRLAFVPNYDDGTVTVIDLWGERILDTVRVGVHPSGGVVLPGDIEYAVAVRGENKVLFVNTASHRVVDSLVDGIGDSPFSVVTSPDGRLLFVNNTASHDVSVIALPERRVVARIPVAEVPIVMAVHPSGRELWVSSEGGDRISVIAIPPQWRRPPAVMKPGVTTVAVMGMIHSGHLTSQRYGLTQVGEMVRRFRPDVVCAEIAPDRWERIWSDYTERGVIEDPRVLRFPEYFGAMLALSAELGFEIVPCAGWTKEMSDLREVRIKAFETQPAYLAARAEYAARLAAVRSRYREPLADIDDPRVIHSRAYDERQREVLELYDHYQNDLIGPGGWTTINRAHLRLIDRTIRAHRGQRVLVTFGAGHRYRILDALRLRRDVLLVPDRELVGPAAPAGQLPAWLPGVWSREWIERQGTRTSTFTVRYLQTPAGFGDLRIPVARARRSEAASFADLTDEELRALAKQRGFIGHTTADNLIATWHHEIDFQPPDTSADIGRLEGAGSGRMYEHALDSSYTEHWVSLTSGDGRFLTVRVERGGRLDRILMVAGDYFVYARNRAKDLPAAPSLEALIATTKAARDEIIGYLDCELSVGRIRGGTVPWEIQYSTLPWREGRHLDFVDRIGVRGSSGELVPRAEPGETWTVPTNTVDAGDLRLWFSAKP